MYPRLRPYSFDFFPRGAIWRCELRRLWIVELDSKLARGAFIAHVVVNWALIADRVYASRARVGAANHKRLVTITTIKGA